MKCTLLWNAPCFEMHLALNYSLLWITPCYEYSLLWNTPCFEITLYYRSGSSWNLWVFVTSVLYTCVWGQGSVAYPCPTSGLVDLPGVRVVRNKSWFVTIAIVPITIMNAIDHTEYLRDSPCIYKHGIELVGMPRSTTPSTPLVDERSPFAYATLIT